MNLKQETSLTGDLSAITNSLKLTDRASLILRAAHPARKEKERILIETAIVIVKRSMFLAAIVKIGIASMSIT